MALIQCDYSMHSAMHIVLVRTSIFSDTVVTDGRFKGLLSKQHFSNGCNTVEIFVPLILSKYFWRRSTSVNAITLPVLESICVSWDGVGHSSHIK